MPKKHKRLIGTAAGDKLTGNKRQSWVYGREGDDIIGTEAGRYRVWGNEGRDKFVTLNDAKGYMNIMDMEPGETIEFCGCPATRVEQRGKNAWIVKLDDIKAVVMDVDASQLELDFTSRLITLVGDPLG